jgi:hypothetical protein
MENEPLQPDEYSLANEARLLRQLIESAPSPNLKQALILALAKVLYQDEERALRNHETLTARAVHQYVSDCMEAIAKVLQEELPDEQTLFRIVDRTSEELAALAPRNTAADLKLLK